MISRSQMENWASLKREATILEQYINQRLQSLPASKDVKPAAALDIESGSSLDAESTRLREIDESIQKFTEVVEKLSIIASQQQPPSIAHTAAVSNLQGALQDLRSAYRRQAASLRERRQEELLLAEARQRQGGAGGGRDGHSSATDMLLRERGALTQSHSVVDEILSRAAETTSTLARQRSAISTAAGRLGGVAGRIPGLQGLMQAIHSRRIKNEVIMALVIATLICFTIWWVWPRSSSSSSGTA